MHSSFCEKNFTGKLNMANRPCSEKKSLSLQRGIESKTEVRTPKACRMRHGGMRCCLLPVDSIITTRRSITSSQRAMDSLFFFREKVSSILSKGDKTHMFKAFTYLKRAHSVAYLHNKTQNNQPFLNSHLSR